MKTAFSAITSSDEERRTLFTSFRGAGYDGLQLKGSQYLDYLDEPGRFLDDWGHIDGVASALIAGCSLNEEGIELLKKIFAFGRTVGSRMIVFCHCVPHTDLKPDDLRAYAFVLSELGKCSREMGVKLSLHNHYDQPVMLREDIRVFFDAVEKGTVGLTADTAHFAKSGVNGIAGIIREFRDVIDNFHLKDFAEGEFRVLGEGNIDFTPIFQAIRDIGYDGWISADEESGSDITAAMKKCRDFISSGLPVF